MFIIPFSQIKTEQEALVGKKGLSLGILRAAKFQVPEGYVITSQAFDEFLKANDFLQAIQTELDRINLEDMHSVEYASQLITDLIVSADLNDELMTAVFQQFKHINAQFVAVRTSVFSEEGEVSWEEELESFLQVPPDMITDHIKKCWAALFSTKSLYHFYQKKLSPLTVRIAVIVQRMIDSDLSGLLYTAHPVSHDDNNMVIEAGFGLGEVKGGGAIIPDTYTVQQKPFKILDKKIVSQKAKIAAQDLGGTTMHELESKDRDKQKLSDKLIKEVAELGDNIEKELGYPAEIEWLYCKKASDYDEGGFWVVEARKMSSM